VIKFEEVIAYF